VTVPALPAEGSTAWYPWATGIDTAARGAVSADRGGLEELAVNAAATGAVTVDLINGNVHDLTLTGDVTLTLTGATAGVACSATLILRQDATGTRLATWPGSVNWGAAGAPVLSTAASAYDVVSLLTVDGGTTWIGFHTGMSTPATPTPGGGGGGVAFSGAKVKPSGVQNAANGVVTPPLLFAVEVWDVDGWHAAGDTSRLTVPLGKDGYISLSAQIDFASNATGVRQARIIKNGNAETRVATVNAAAVNGLVTTVQLSGKDIAAVGDYYQVIVHQNSGTGLGIPEPQTWFEAQYIGPVA
jgi:hypothetical protein